MAELKTNRFFHGGDYNPEQWMEYPEILEEDIRLMKEAKITMVSVGIFSWAFLEPEEGRYEFGWLDKIIDRLTEAGIDIDLATPSGARPAWLAEKYPEVLRYDKNFQPYHYGQRHNHCLTSPLYRQKVQAMDSALAKHYAGHPGIKLIHISNEFCGYCYCPKCVQAFREWLQRKYGSLAELNRCWWADFWSQRYSSWSQIEPPSPMGMFDNPSMALDWKRFETEQVRSFIEMERKAVHEYMPEVPVTINLMDRFNEYDLFTLSSAVDVVSWDAYPRWGAGDDLSTAIAFAMEHDMMRSFKNQPFLLMESTPSLVNWHPVNKLKRPGMHMLASLQAVAHGSQSVMMFQWRKGRGGAEAFHGAVVSHDGRDDTRVFRDVRQVGEALENLAPVLDARPDAKVCLIFDYENWWALDEVQAALRGNMRYFDTVLLFYRAFREKGISVDFRNMSPDLELSAYQLVVAPLLFMFRNGIEEKLKAFTAAGGTLLTTFFSGQVNEFDLAYLGDAPHGLTDVLGLRAEELDSLYPDQSNELVMAGGQRLTVHELCEIPRDVSAECVGTYARDFYGGLPCLTKNAYGKGTAWYLAAKPDQAGVNAVLEKITEGMDLPQAFPGPLPEGVLATARGEYVFLQNFSGSEQHISFPGKMTDLISGREFEGEYTMPVNGILVLKQG